MNENQNEREKAEDRFAKKTENQPQLESRALEQKKGEHDVGEDA